MPGAWWGVGFLSHIEGLHFTVSVLALLGLYLKQIVFSLLQMSCLHYSTTVEHPLASMLLQYLQIIPSIQQCTIQYLQIPAVNDDGESAVSDDNPY